MSTTSSGRRGLFVTFEGQDGSGKTTQIRLLAERLRQMGHTVIETAEPGGTRIGKMIRGILLGGGNNDLSPTTEMLLFFASRSQALDEWIAPALAQGHIVLSDRWTDSTRAYQGGARGLGEEAVLATDRIACRGMGPDITIYLDIDQETSIARALARNEAGGNTETRLDEESSEFHRKARETYYDIARKEPARFRLIDARAEPAEVADRVWAAVAPVVPHDAG